MDTHCVSSLTFVRSPFLDMMLSTGVAIGLNVLSFQMVNDVILRFAIDASIEEGKKLRVDTPMVVETNIHWPHRRNLIMGFHPSSNPRDPRRLRQIAPNSAPQDSKP